MGAGRATARSLKDLPEGLWGMRPQRTKRGRGKSTPSDSLTNAKTCCRLLSMITTKQGTNEETRRHDQLAAANAGELTHAVCSRRGDFRSGATGRLSASSDPRCPRLTLLPEAAGGRMDFVRAWSGLFVIVGAQVALLVLLWIWTGTLTN